MIWWIIYKNLFFDLKQWNSNSILVMPITNFTYIPAVNAFEHSGRKRTLAPILDIMVTRLIVKSTRRPKPLNTIHNFNGDVKQPTKFDLCLPSEVLNFFNQLQICRLRPYHYFLKQWRQLLFLNQSQRAHRQLHLKWVWVHMFAKMIRPPTTPLWKSIWLKTDVWLANVFSPKKLRRPEGNNNKILTGTELNNCTSVPKRKRIIIQNFWDIIHEMEPQST